MDKAIEEIAKKIRLTPSRCTFGQEPQCTYGVAYLAQEHFTEPIPILCKWCGSKDVMKYGIMHGIQYYMCSDCHRAFTAKGTPYGRQTPTEQIGSSLSMYYDGLSFADIARHINQTYNNPVNVATVYRWVLDYTQIAKRLLDLLTPKVSHIWVVDETVIKIAGKNVWFWDVIDNDTRFLLASHLSKERTINDVKVVMERAQNKATKSPHIIISDSLAAYPDGIEQVFGADSKHIQSWGMTQEINTNLIERFHGTIKERTKVLRGFKRMDNAQLILDGFLIHYNFFKPHMALKDGIKPKGIDKTPAEVAGIKVPVKNWLELVKKGIKK